MADNVAAEKQTRSLPILLSADRKPFDAVPRRYEETKGAIIQDFTHMNIVAMGNQIHQQLLRKCTSERDHAIQGIKKAITARAEKQKSQALVTYAKKVTTEHEFAIKGLKEAHENAMEAKVLDVEAEMQRVTMELIQDTRNICDRQLQKAVEMTEEHCQEELADAVKVARIEERALALEKTSLLKLQHKEKLEAALDKQAEENVKELLEFKEQMDAERKVDMERTRLETEDSMQDRMQDLREEHSQHMLGLRQQLKCRSDAVRSLQRDLEGLKVTKQQVEEELMNLRLDFQHFINNTRPFEEGNADYLIGPVRSFKPTSPTPK